MPIVTNLQEDQEQQGTMDNAFQQNQQPVNISGGQGAAIQTGSQSQVQPSANNRTKEQTGTGFTNVQKYVDANKSGAQNISGAINKNVGNQAQGIRQAIQNNQSQFQQQLNANKERLQGGQQFGQQSIQKASNAINLEDEQKRQADLQKRMGLLNYNQNTDYNQSLQAKQQEIANQQAQFNVAKEAEKNYLASFNRGIDAQKQIETNYEAKLQELFPTRKDNAGNLQWTYNSDQARQQVEQAKQAYLANPSISNIYSQQFKQFDDARAAQDSTLGQLRAQKTGINENIANQQNLLNQGNQDLERLQFEQTQAQRASQLGAELSTLQDKINNNVPLTPEEITRFRNIVEGNERYDTAQYQEGTTSEQARALNALTSAANTESGRRELLRQTFAQPNRGYNRGQTSLDQLLLQGNPDVASNLISGVQQAGADTVDMSTQARKNALRQMAEMSFENQALQKNLSQGVTTAEDSLRTALENRATTGEGSFLKSLQDAVNDGLLSQEQAQELSLNQGQTYGFDIANAIQNPGDYATMESVANLSDVARAQALAQLGGRASQNIFANEDRVGQKSEKEKQKLLEIQEGIRNAQKGSATEEANLASGLAGAGNQFGAADEYFKPIREANSAATLNKLNSLVAQRGGIDNLTAEDLQSLERDYANPQNIGMKNFAQVIPADQAMADFKARMLQNRIGVEGSEDSLVQGQIQKQNSELEARKKALELLGATTFARSDRGLQTANSYYAPTSGIDAEGYRFSSNPFLNNTGTASDAGAESLLQAYNRITGNNLKPIG